MHVYSHCVNCIRSKIEENVHLINVDIEDNNYFSFHTFAYVIALNFIETLLSFIFQILPHFWVLPHLKIKQAPHLKPTPKPRKLSHSTSPNCYFLVRRPADVLWEEGYRSLTAASSLKCSEPPISQSWSKCCLAQLAQLCTLKLSEARSQAGVNGLLAGSWLS